MSSWLRHLSAVIGIMISLVAIQGEQANGQTAPSNEVYGSLLDAKKSEILAKIDEYNRELVKQISDQNDLTPQQRASLDAQQRHLRREVGERLETTATIGSNLQKTYFFMAYMWTLQIDYPFRFRNGSSNVYALGGEVGGIINFVFRMEGGQVYPIGLRITPVWLVSFERTHHLQVKENNSIDGVTGGRIRHKGIFMTVDKKYRLINNYQEIEGIYVGGGISWQTFAGSVNQDTEETSIRRRSFRVYMKAPATFVDANWEPTFEYGIPAAFIVSYNEGDGRAMTSRAYSLKGFYMKPFYNNEGDGINPFQKIDDAAGWLGRVYDNLSRRF